MAPWDRPLAALVAHNNDHVHRADPEHANPRPLEGVAWHRRLVAAHGTIRAEWDHFAAAGHLPAIGDLLAEDQGNVGPWQAGLLVSGGRATELARDWFPETLAALGAVSGLRAALWSVLAPGTEIPEHCGPNGGVLRYHLGVVCPDGAALQVGDRITPYREGEGILFDDTEPHSAWNRSDRPRVTLFCELDRPVRGPARWENLAVQAIMGVDPRRRAVEARAEEWHATLNRGRRGRLA